MRTLRASERRELRALDSLVDGVLEASRLCLGRVSWLIRQRWQVSEIWSVPLQFQVEGSLDQEKNAG